MPPQHLYQPRSGYPRCVTTALHSQRSSERLLAAIGQAFQKRLPHRRGADAGRAEMCLLNAPALFMKSVAPRHEPNFGNTSINSETTDATEARAASDQDQMPGNPSMHPQRHTCNLRCTRWSKREYKQACFIGARLQSAKEGSSLRNALLEQGANSST